MEFAEKSCAEFVEVLSTKAPVPGGGGASALVAAVGAALGSMVGSLTAGKKKYADVEAEILSLMAEAERLRKDFLQLIDRDAEVFEPLSKAYRMPSGTDDEKAAKEAVMEKALLAACLVPMEIMEKCCEGLNLVRGFAEKGSVLAVSDAGVAAVCLKAALQGASLNVFINTKMMKDRACAEDLNRKAEAMLSQYMQEADDIFASVRERL